MPEVVTVYFDYLCPYAWRGAEVAELVSEPLGLEFHWQHFSLYQSNYQGDENWQLWNEKVDPDSDNGSKGLLAFLASCAARKQGEARYHQFRLRLLRARHKEHQSLTEKLVFEVAQTTGMHLPKFKSDLADPECRTMLAKEHYRATSLDVFGTPTFHFANGHLAYLRIKQLPEGHQEAIELFQDYRQILERYPYLETIKRPRPRGN